MEQVKTEITALLDVFYKSTGIGALCLDTQMNFIACAPAPRVPNDSTHLCMGWIVAFLKDIYADLRKRPEMEKQFYTLVMGYHFICNIVLVNAVVTDVLPAGLIPSSVKLGDSSGVPVTRNDSAGKGSGEYSFIGTTLNYYAPAAINSSQTLTIVTPVPDSYFQKNNAVFSNYATMKADSGVYPAAGVKSSTVKVGVGPGGNVSSVLEKQAVTSLYNSTTGTVTWRLTVNRNAVALPNVTLTDTIPADQTYQNDAAFYDSNFSAPLASQPFSTLLNGSTLSWNIGNISAGTSYYIQYTTRLDPSITARNGNYTTQKNHAVLDVNGTSTVLDINTTVARGVIQKNALGYDYRSTGRTISWSIDVNHERMSLTGNTVAADGTNHNNGVIVKDDLSAMDAFQFGFVNGSTVTIASQDSPNTPVTAAPVGSLAVLTEPNTYYYDAGNKLLYINVGSLNGPITASREKIIKFNTPLSSDVNVNTYFSGNWTYQIPNTASLLDDQYIGSEATTTAKQGIDNNVVKKAAQYQSGADYIDWEVTLNQNAVDLGQVSLDDDLSGKPLTLDTSSIRLFRQILKSDGTFQKGIVNATTNPYGIDMSSEVTLPASSVKYSATDKIFHFTVPENVSGRPYLLTFRTYIDRSQSGASAQDISNTIQFTGVATSRTGSGKAGNVQFQWGYGKATGHAGSVTVRKTNNHGNPLQGATFDLLDQNGNLLKVSAPTGADGKVTIDQLTYSAVYSIVEDSPPANYIKNTVQQTVSVSGSAPTASLTFTDTLKTGTICLHKIDSTGNGLAGAEFMLYDAGGNPVGTPQVSDQNGLVSFSSIPYGVYAIRETGVPTDYSMAGTDIAANLTDSNALVASGTLDLGTVTNTIKTAGITLTKVGTGGEKLSGAVFTLYHDAAGTSPVTIAGLPVTGTTGVNGFLQLADISYGDYYLLETTSPDDYAPVVPIPVSLHDSNHGLSGGVLSLGNIVDSKKLGTISFTKLDEKGSSLAGATFVLKDTAGTPVGVPQISDTNGLVTFSNVPYGTYTIQEINAPTDYMVSSADIAVNLRDGNSQVISGMLNLGSVSNTLKTAGISLTKVGTGGEKLSGAVFTLYHDPAGKSPVMAGGKAVTGTTDSNGLLQLTGIPYGNYYLAETASPADYEPVTPIPVSLHDSNHALSGGNLLLGNIVDEKKLGSITFSKLDEKGNGLAGATFILKNSSGAVLGKPETSDRNGRISFTGIPYGNGYSITETQAPDDFQILPTPITGINLHASAIILCAVSNARLTGSISFIKVDENGKSLAGAEFTLYDPSGSQIGQTQISDKDGKVIFHNVPFQDGYTIKETKAPVNYAMHAPFTINLHTVSYDYGKVTDSLLRGSIRVTKTDSSNDPLSNAVFMIYNTDGKSIGQAISGTDGIAIFSDIPYGEYIIRETAAPEGYEFDESTHSVSLNAQNPDVTVPVIDTKIPSLPNPKTGSDCKFPSLEAGLLALASCGIIVSKRIRFRKRKQG